MSKPKIEIEFCVFKLASWAPNIDGQSFDWAYRVTSPTGNQVIGVSNGKKSTAKQKAQAVANKMKELAVNGTGKFKFSIAKNKQRNIKQ